MKKPQRYQVQGIAALDGLEFLVDPPVGRRLYGPGEVVEIAEGQVNIDRLLDFGIIQLDKSSGPLARPAICPECHDQFVNAGGTVSTCDHCGAVWAPLGELKEGGT